MFNRVLNSTVAIGVRVEPELERRLDQLALSLGKYRSACVREAIALDVEPGVSRSQTGLTGLTGRHDDQRPAVVVQANR